MATQSPKIIVLKFGGSILRNEHELAQAVHEVYRWWREGWQVVSVVSAFMGVTDTLLTQARRYGDDNDPAAIAALAATGEETTSSLLALALEKAGIQAEALDALRLNLRTKGPTLDAEPVSIDTSVIRRSLDRGSAVVVPGFVGRDEEGRPTLLGRGGTDCSAIFLASSLGARCRLIKDVRGLYERDPARPGPLARVYRSLAWEDALHLDGRIIQHKAVQYAKGHGLEFEVSSINSPEASSVGSKPKQWGGVDQKPPPPLKVGMLGLGAVGLGVYRLIHARPDLFKVVKAAVRSVGRHSDSGVPTALLTCDPWGVAKADCDVIIELIGGEQPAGDIMADALKKGVHVITANKRVIAQRGVEYHTLAEQSGATLSYSAAVGGVAPTIETVRRVAQSEGVVGIEAIVNGTTTFVLDKVASGLSYDEAVREAQAAGLAEADPSLDVNGGDAQDKIRILVREAGGPDLKASDVKTTGIDKLNDAEVRAACTNGRVMRLVASAVWNADGTVTAKVEPRVVEPGEPLAGTFGTRCRCVVTGKSGVKHVALGKGAGRWPTAEAVFADLLEIVRRRAGGAAVASVLAEPVVETEVVITEEIEVTTPV